MVDAHFPSVLIATPCYGGQMTVGYFRGLELIRQALDGAGVTYDVLLNENESNINRARNVMTGLFLETEFDVLAFIDADIEFHDGEQFLDLLVMNGIRGAAVGCKTPDGLEYLNVWKDGEQLRRNRMVGTHIPVDYVGTAVFLIDRATLETLSSEYTFPLFDAGGFAAPAMFECQVVAGELSRPGVYLSEDYAVCQLARDVGVPVRIDSRVVVTHHGRAAWRF